MTVITKNLKRKNQKPQLVQAFRRSSQPSPKAMAGTAGQAMLIVVLILGATMLGVSTIAGYVSLQKIRAVTDIVDSTKAIYAADSGVEWCFYEKFGPQAGTSTPPCDGGFNLGNDSSVSIVEQNNEVKSIGTANRAYRAFGIFLDQFGL